MLAAEMSVLCLCVCVRPQVCRCCCSTCGFMRGRQQEASGYSCCDGADSIQPGQPYNQPTCPDAASASDWRPVRTLCTWWGSCQRSHHSCFLPGNKSFLLVINFPWELHMASAYSPTLAGFTVLTGWVALWRAKVLQVFFFDLHWKQAQSATMPHHMRRDRRRQARWHWAWEIWNIYDLSPWWI